MSSRTVEVPRPISWKTRILARLIMLLVRALYTTVRVQVTGEEASQKVLRETNGGLLVTWHGRTLLPFNWYRFRNYWALVSLSRDGDLQAEHSRCFGFRIIRGSTGRRGVAATRELLAALNDGGIAALTPDGPRGPSQKVQPGILYFAQRLGKPIIPVGSSAYPRWQISTWDRFLVPKPFSRARIHIGAPIYITTNESLEDAALRVEAAINALEAQAEQDVLPRKHRDNPEARES